jgi:DNA-binding protein
MISYVVAAITQFNTRNSNMIVLKARGRAIPKAFDVSEIMRSKFIQDLKVNDIQVVMEEVNHEDGSTSSEPFVEIYMSR